MAAHDPYASYNFLVDGINVAAFAEVSGLGVEIEQIEYRDGNEPTTVRKLPGLTKFANIVLKRGVTDTHELWDWMQDVMNGTINRKAGAIVLLNQAQDEIARWNFNKAWPCKWEGPSLSATESGIAFETVEICHEGLQRA